MSVNVDVLDVDGGGENFQSTVVETVERGQQSQVLRNARSQRLVQRMVVHRQSNIMGKQT